MQGDKYGVVYVAFGREYDNLAAHTVQASLPKLNLPVCVMSNLGARERSPLWADLPGVTFRDFDLHTDLNRAVKTRLYRYTPFEYTVYIDCDAIVQHTGITRMLAYAQNHQLCLQHTRTWYEGTKCARLYRDTVVRFQAKLPLPIYLGGFFSFARKSPLVTGIFDTWHMLWRDGGQGRDMPALAIAVQRSGFQPKVITADDDLFSFGLSDTAVVVHRAHPDDLHTHFGMPKYEMNKPFDKAGDWDKVYLDRPDEPAVEREVQFVR